MPLGLLPFAERIAALAEDVARAKKGERERRRRIAEGTMPMLTDAYLAGLQQALIVVRGNTDATLAIAARMREIRGEP